MASVRNASPAWSCVQRLSWTHATCRARGPARRSRRRRPGRGLPVRVHGGACAPRSSQPCCPWSACRRPEGRGHWHSRGVHGPGRGHKFQVGHRVGDRQPRVHGPADHCQRDHVPDPLACRTLRNRPCALGHRDAARPGAGGPGHGRELPQYVRLKRPLRCGMSSARQADFRDHGDFAAPADKQLSGIMVSVVTRPGLGPQSQARSLRPRGVGRNPAVASA